MAASETLTDYERRRQENIRRNDAMMASLLLRRKADDLATAAAAAAAASRPKKQLRTTTTSPASDHPVVLRRSLRTRGLPPSSSSSPPPPTPPPPPPPKPRGKRFTISEAFVGDGRDASAALVSALLDASAASKSDLAACRDDAFDAAAAESGMVLKPGNVRKMVPDRIFAVRFLPFAERMVVAAGDKTGHLGFWDVDGGGDGGGGRVFDYMPHRGPVTGIAAHLASPGKIYSCSYEGELCLMDVEKEIFKMIYLCNSRLSSVCQWPNDSKTLYFAKGDGELRAFDERVGKISAMWSLHEQRINSIDFHPENTNLMATSSSDRMACLWDLRIMKDRKPACFKVIQHQRAVHSAFFSPSGSSLATTSFDNTVGISSGSCFNHLCFVKHHNQTGRWLSSFKAIWGWNDSCLFIGNMRRAIDIISDSHTATLESEHMTTIPCRLSAHPYKVGHLAAANSSGKVFLWTKT